jgi:alkylation response protein AidB-like acyl-CoA dehydrogenase
MTATALPDTDSGGTAAPPGDPAEILRRARALAPVLRERADEIERARMLPPDVVESLRATGVFRMGFARDWGGPELDSMAQTEVIEALSYGDAAAGWCAMIGSDTGLYAAFLDREVAESMFANLDTVTAGLLFPSGRADAVPGGWRLTGRWQFGSGITHADWVISGAFRYRDGDPEPGPGGVGHGSILLMVPRSDVEVLDTWHTTGLAGSGSCDYTITDLFVPAEHTLYFSEVRSGAGVLAQPEVHMRNMPGVPLGVARAALDHARQSAVAAGRSDDYRTQIVLADCEADFAAARHAVYGALRRQHDVLSSGGVLDDLSALDRAALPLSRRYAFRAARRIVSRLYDLAQTSAIYRPSPLDRWLRDTTTMCQHVVAQDRILQTAGAHLLGARPSFPLALGITAAQR